MGLEIIVPTVGDSLATHTEMFSADQILLEHWTLACFTMKIIPKEESTWDNFVTLHLNNFKRQCEGLRTAIAVICNFHDIFIVTISNADINTRDGVLMLGQDQDTVGGGTNPEQSFSGQIGFFGLWDYILEDEVIDQMKICQFIHEGNLVNWNLDHWELNEVNSVIFDNKELCEPNPLVNMLSLKQTFLDLAVQTCKILGGTMPTNVNVEYYRQLSNTYLDFDVELEINVAPVCIAGNTLTSWLGLKSNKDLDWIDQFSGTNHGNEVAGNLAKKPGQCLETWKHSIVLVDCQNIKSCSFCNVSKHEFLILKGLPDEDIYSTLTFDRHFYFYGRRNGFPALR